ncbi:MAG: hypothetical protein Q8P23_03180 [bacterium]|nr:hypothetical protein [bacterium]
MDNELTNLLPPERQQALSRAYLLRIGTVAALLITTLIVVAGLLLLPTYILLAQKAVTKQTQFANIESIFSSADEKALSARLTTLANDAVALMALGRTPSASATVRGALAVPRPGITLFSFAYVPATGKIQGTLAVSGIATTRDALRTYQLALQSAPFAAAAALPVSAYAKDSDIAFTITVTLTP